MAAARRKSFCAQCGLPVAAPPEGRGETRYCCHACRFVAGIVGSRGEGEEAWHLLRLGVGVLLAMNIMMISLLLYAGTVEPQAEQVFRALLCALAAPAVVILLAPLTGSARSGKKSISFDLFIATGSLAAFGVSAVNTFRGTGPIYFDTATMLPVLVVFGRIIESGAKSRAQDLLHSLEALLPAAALVASGSAWKEVPIGLLRPGDLVRVRPGERVAVDGRITEGTTTIEETPLSGELLPRHCAPGDAVFAGTVNGIGTVIVETKAAGEEVLLHRLVALIDDSWQNPSEAERIAERAAKLFVPVVLVVAAGTALFWEASGEPAKACLSALSVLVVACPCTMGIATPLATSLAIGRAARAGIVVRGGRVMEMLGALDLVWFDKTGTCTTGRPVVTQIRPCDPRVTEEELLGRLAALEGASEHCLARGIVSEAERRGFPPGSVTGVTVVPGQGIRGTVLWRGEAAEVTAGTVEFAGGVSPAEGEESAIDISWKGEVRGRVLLAEALRTEAPRTIAALRERGVQTALLSGDRFAAAAAVGRRLGIDRVEAPRRPEEKKEAIAACIADGRTVAMVGDGINDGPALAAAHVGIAIGGGTDFARRAGNVVILSEHLLQIPWLIDLGRETRQIVRCNFALSFGYNAVALAAAAAGWLHPLLAAVAMVASSLTVLGNSLRIRSFPSPPVS